MATCAREECCHPFVPRRGGRPQKFCSRNCKNVTSSAAWKATNPERVAQYTKAYNDVHVADQAAWRRANPEKTRAAWLRYSHAHREQRNRRHAKWYAGNRECAKNAHSDWMRRNPDRNALYHARRRALRGRASGTCTVEQLQARIDFYGGRCWMCGVSYEAIDHVIPLSKGGTNWPVNLRPACKHCNSRKKDRDWRAYGGS